MSFFSNKTILITGATGLIGSHIVDVFMAMDDVYVVVLSRNEKKIKTGFAQYISNPYFSYIVQDVSTPLKIENNVIDFIFHAAGPMERKIIDQSPIDVISANIVGTQNCLDFLYKQETTSNVRGRLVLFSSVTVYGNTFDHDRIVSESDTEITGCIEAENACYSQSKRMSEVIVQAYRKQQKIDAVIARLSTVYGYSYFKPDTAFFEFIDNAISGEDIVINNSGAAKRDNIYIDDVISGLITVCQRGIGGQSYNISSGAELGNFAAIDEIAKIIVDIVNKKNNSHRTIKVVYKVNEDERRKPGIILDNRKLRSLGWSLKTDLIEGITKTIYTYK